MTTLSQSTDFPFYACKVGHVETIRNFLNSEDALNKKLHSPYRMLMIASKNGHLEIVKLLLDSPFSKNERTYSEIKDYMHEAIQKGYLDIVKFLREIPVFKEETDDAKCARVVLFSAGSGQLNILKYALQEFKDDPMTKQVLENGGAIEAACEEGKLDVVQFLIELPIERKNKQLTPFFESAYKYDRLEVLQYLIFELNLEKNDDINQLMNNKPNIQVEQLFEMKKLNNALQKELCSTDNSKLKKMKV